MNIQRHEDGELRQSRSTRTSLFDVFGQSDDFAEFEALLEKCTRADRTRRPKNAVELRNEDVLAVFRHRLEKGERPCDIVLPPFGHEKYKQIRKVGSQRRLVAKKETEGQNSKLENLKKNMGAKGGAGHFFGNDRETSYGGERYWMQREDLTKVLRLLSLGEKKVNLKERGLRAFLNTK